ncbi:MAG TPA: 7-cyano-7-deazaguanine synthase QueC [Stellaceae bacterium]|jgi:7-cyano-7-deazaguanine synthase|nr:7-cyano-7-deazaguanine synthase QueC [Stellaceae bacterium]
MHASPSDTRSHTQETQGRPAIVLVSGGLDSATVLAIARTHGYTVNALSFDYGQRHRLELDASRRVAEAQGVARHAVMSFDMRQFGGSALTDDIAVPKHRDAGSIGEDGVIPVTYVPARNTIFLSFALAFAEVTGAKDLFIGVNALDYSGYPDCRPEFIRAFETMANLATKAGVEESQAPLTIHAPLMTMTKADIIRRGTELGVDYALTLSCYDPLPPNLACGACDSCQLRRKGFAEAGVPDPTVYYGQPG